MSSQENFKVTDIVNDTCQDDLQSSFTGSKLYHRALWFEFSLTDQVLLITRCLSLIVTDWDILEALKLFSR